MSQFLVVQTRKVVDTPASPAVDAIPEVVEDLTANPPIVGVPEVPAVPAVAEVSHREVESSYIENSAAQVAKNVSDPDQTPGAVYYAIKFNKQLKPVLKAVREKGRAAAPAKEIITIEDQDGNELGSAEI